MSSIKSVRRPSSPLLSFIHHQIAFPKTPDLVELLDLVTVVAPALARSLADIRALPPYGVEVRYPGDIPEVSPADARQAVELAGKVREAIRAALKAHD